VVIPFKLFNMTDIVADLSGYYERSRKRSSDQRLDKLYLEIAIEQDLVRLKQLAKSAIARANPKLASSILEAEIAIKDYEIAMVRSLILL